MTDLLYLMPSPARSIELFKVFCLAFGFATLFVSGKTEKPLSPAERQEVRFVPGWLKEAVFGLPDSLRSKANDTYRELTEIKIQAEENAKILAASP